MDVPDYELDKAVQFKTKAPKGYMYFKTAESIVCFLVYVAMTYKSLIPYLKELYLSLNSWRKNRDNKGWKLLGKRKREKLKKGDLESALLEWVETVPLLQDDMEALMRLTSATQAP